MEPPRVLVTRPEPSASRTAEALRKRGFIPLVLPLTTIQPLATPVPAYAYSAVLATSANAFVGMAEAPRALAALPIHVVGSATAAAAEKVGFTDIRVGSGDAAGLANEILTIRSVEEPLLYLAGRVRRPELEASLLQAGFTLEIIETYDTRQVEPKDAAMRLKALEPVDAILLMSVGAAAALRDLHGHDRTALQAAPVFCLSPRIAEEVSALSASAPLVAAEPTEGALLDRLDDWAAKRTA